MEIYFEEFLIRKFAVIARNLPLKEDLDPLLRIAYLQASKCV